jgi:NAD(P)-dependent dehydrogenase (short-subunit alcohol dehydrogenase family)
MGHLDNNVAIITGSTYGIGEAIAEILAKEGAVSIVTGRRPRTGVRRSWARSSEWVARPRISAWM